MLAALGFAVSAALHLLSFTRWAGAAGERTIWGLGVVAFLLALAMLARLRRSATLGRRRWGRVALLDWRGMIRSVPPGLRFLIVGAALYAWMNFVLCLMLDLPPEAQPAITLRMASGHLIFFFLVPLVYFRWSEPALAAGQAAAPPPHP
jgi:hypothetical protein